MSTYSNEDFERIGAAIGVSPPAVAEYRNQFEAAAAWYRSDCRTPQRVPPSNIKRQAKLIAAAAKKLKRGKASGLDGLAPELYQQSARNLQRKVADEEDSCAQTKHVVAESQLARHAQRRVGQVGAIYVVDDVQNENEG